VNESDFSRMLQIEEEYIKKVCDEVIAAKPDLVFTEKGVSDLAQHYLVKAGITAIRRVRKTDNNRIARACGATVVSRTDEIKEEDLGLGCGLFEVRKLGDEYFTFVEQCKDPKACTILLRGASKDILMEVERNLLDAMNVARNVMMDARLVPGGGATEMALSVALTAKSNSIEGVAQRPYKAVAKAFEVIPRTLIQNCGGNTIRTLTALRAKHAPRDDVSWGVDGSTGEIKSMNELGIWDAYAVKVQVIKTAIETATMLLRIDAIVSGGKSKRGQSSGAEQQGPPMEDM
jgi:T-complex protein 1 subunit gamma